MSPTTEQIKIPDGFRLERQPTCQPQAETPTAVRDRDGRVLAQLQAWTPSGALN